MRILVYCLKGVTEIDDEVKEQNGDFLSMLLGTLGASLLGIILTGQGINRAEKDRGIETKKVEKAKVTETKKVEKATKWIFNAASSFN